ncbi:5,10-methenyltetrahydrofolate synthetase-like protein [Umbelopsis sp. PMI_123]|nr:5,10-methenyltetrahydrofolate synthetase-like protein [Umbelopsis sp. PMI_123]
MAAVKAMKKALRKELAERLKLVTKDVAQQESKLVTEKLLNLQEYRNSKNVSVYISMDGEINTRDVIRNIFDANKSCYVPRFMGSATMTMVKLNSWEDFLSLPVNKWNIPEPPADEVREDALEKHGLDLIIVPGVGFDIEGNRIGHGRGYYDRYMQQCQEWAAKNNRQPPKTVALALRDQIVDIRRIPLEPTDRKPDVLLTPDDVIRTK